MSVREGGQESHHIDGDYYLAFVALVDALRHSRAIVQARGDDERFSRPGQATTLLDPQAVNVARTFAFRPSYSTSPAGSITSSIPPPV